MTYSYRGGNVKGRHCTFDTGFPNCVRVFKTCHYIVVDLECKIQAVFAPFFQDKPWALGISILGNRENNIRSTGRFNCKAQDLHFRIQGFYIIQQSQKVSRFIPAQKQKCFSYVSKGLLRCYQPQNPTEKFRSVKENRIDYTNRGNSSKEIFGVSHHNKS